MAKSIENKNQKKGKKLQRYKYSQADLDNALILMEKGTPLRQASRQYNIPKSTLSLKSRDDCEKKIIRRPGPKSILSVEEENKIAMWILERFDAKRPVTKTQLLDNVKLYLDISKRTSPFKDNRPGRHWFNSFLKRHPRISERTSQNLSDARNKATEGKIRAWFTEIQNYLNVKNLIDIDPSRVFNCDESAFFLNPSGDRVLARRGSKAVHKVVDGSDKETLTVLFTVSAAGDIPSPMILYWYSRIPSEVSSQIPKEWSFGCTEKGWMTSKSFYEYIANVFYPWLLKNNVQLPVILYLDGHSSHLTMPLSEFCREKGIEVIALPPNATHILQPLDVGFFGPLKKNWSKAINEWKFQHSNIKFRKPNFAPLLKKTTDSMNFPSIAKNAFRVCGLFPFDSDAVPYINLGTTDFDEESIRNDKNRNDVNDEKEKSQEQLVFFEKNLSIDVLSSFKKYEELGLQSLSSIDLANDGLYKYWLKLKQLIGDKMEVCDALINNETTDILGSNATESVLFDIILPLNQNETNFPLDAINISENIEIIPHSSSNVSSNLSIEDTIIENSNTQMSSKSMSNIQNESGPFDIFNEKNLQSEDVSHSKDLGNEIEAVFNEIFIWPKEPETFRKVRKIDKIPSVVTSDEWNKYQKQKEEEKLTKQKELQDKREARKQVQKEKAEEKVQKKLIAENKKKIKKEQIVSKNLKKRKRAE